MTIKNAHVSKFKDPEWLLQVLPDGITGRVAFDSMGDRIYAEYQVRTGFIWFWLALAVTSLGCN